MTTVHRVIRRICGRREAFCTRVHDPLQRSRRDARACCRRSWCTYYVHVSSRRTHRSIRCTTRRVRVVGPTRRGPYESSYYRARAGPIRRCTPCALTRKRSVVFLRASYTNFGYHAYARHSKSLKSSRGIGFV